MATTPTLPAHIRQLVDKKNYVIAIKTHAQERNISLDEAKNQIDAYEASQTPLAQNPVIPNPSKNAVTDGFNVLTQSLDSQMQQENIKLPLIPYWVKRVAIIVLVVGVLCWVIWRAFG